MTVVAKIMFITEESTNSENFSHYSVMPKEIIQIIQIKEGLVYVDGTLGGAGHSGLILEKLNGTGHLYSFDQDINAINRAIKNSKKTFNKNKNLKIDSWTADNWTLVHSNFAELKEFCEAADIKVNGGIILDLGLSSIQLDDPERGFGFKHDAPLDMRLNPDAPLTAYEFINKFKEAEIADVLYKYGDERLSRQIASQILKERPISSTKDLADLIRNCYLRKMSNKKKTFKTHPATRSFQAIRVFINKELDVLEKVLESAPAIMEQSAIIAVLSFQSQEDRIIKWSFRDAAQKGSLSILTKKPLVPSDEEIDENPRSRSAKLRAAQKT